VLAIFLSGCNRLVTLATDETKIKRVINEYLANKKDKSEKYNNLNTFYFDFMAKTVLL